MKNKVVRTLMAVVLVGAMLLGACGKKETVTVEPMEKEEVARVRATSAPSLTSFFPSRKLSPPFQNISFFFGVETPLKQNPSKAFSFW